MEARVDFLKKCLEALAADAEGQLHSLEQQGCVPPDQYVDELALDYDDIAAAAVDMQQKGEIDPATCRRGRELNEHLKTISGTVNAHLWTAEALHTAQEWERVRQMARHCLSHFGR